MSKELIALAKKVQLLQAYAEASVEESERARFKSVAHLSQDDTDLELARLAEQMAELILKGGAK